MGRPLLMIGLVAVLMATGVAVAAPAGQVRLPVTVTAPAETPEHVVVRKGDHLWKISERHVEEHSPDTRVGPYWRRVIEVNVTSLRSGDPDLIYPGETVQLPPLNERQ